MKKLLLLVSILFTTLTYANDTAKVSTTPVLDKTEHLVDKYSSKIADAFASTMESAKPMAKAGFEAVVWLQVAQGIAYLLPLLCFVIFLTLFISEYNKIGNLLKSDKVPTHMNARCGVLHEDNCTPTLIIYLIVAGLMFITALLCTFDGFTHLIAPRWFAIKEIVGLFK